MVSYALAGAAGAYGFGLLSVDGYEHSRDERPRGDAFAGFGSVAANCTSWAWPSSRRSRASASTS